jgi:hypothetical protein
MFQNAKRSVAEGVLSVNLLSVFLLATGVMASLGGALLARFWLTRYPGAGWVYLGSISLRLMALLIGCTAIYVTVEFDRGRAIVVFAIGVALGWVVHVFAALLTLRK